MIVIADASPINHLCQIGHIDLLRTLVGRVIIPGKGLVELSRTSTPPVVRQFSQRLPEWVESRSAANLDESLANLGAGERDAISLAMEIGADLVIIDDKAARRAAIERGLRVLGTLGVLKLASDRKLTDFDNAVERLRDSGFYMSEKLVQKLLRPS